MKPIFINPDHFRPLDKKEWDGPCMCCNLNQARWMFIPANETGAVSICGLCWLYKSVWGQNRSEEIFSYLLKVEDEIGKPFPKAKRKLVRFEDADRILGALALTSRLFQLRASGRQQ